MKSLNELQQGAKEFFDANPKLNEILATADGQYFNPDKLNAATMHARENNGLKVHTIKRIDVMIEEAKAKMRAAVVIPGETKPDYNKLKLDELKEEAAKRKLDTTGFELKKHYIAALEADDAKPEAPAAGEPGQEPAPAEGEAENTNQPIN